MRLLWLGLMVLVMMGCADSLRHDTDPAQEARQALAADPPDSGAGASGVRLTANLSFHPCRSSSIPFGDW